MGNLWRHIDFARLWAGETVEWVTDSISSFGIPTIAIMAFKASALDMGILTSLGNVAYPILGLYAGVMVDRCRRRPLLVCTNLLQVVALTSIPVAFYLGFLSLLQLFVVTLVMSVTIVFFDMAYTSYLPTLIERQDLVEGNSKLETSSSSAAVVGPGIAGGLIKAFGAAPSIAIDALGTLIAAFAILSIKKPEAPPMRDRRKDFWAELREGLRTVRNSNVLRNLAASTSILNFGNSMLLALLLLFAYKNLQLSILLAAISIAVGALGRVVGAMMASKFIERVGLGKALTIGLLLNGVGYFAVRAAVYDPAPAVFASLWLLANIGLPIYDINQLSLRQTIVPDALQGRMNATMRCFGYGAATLGALAGGLMGLQYGILAAMTTGAIISLFATAVTGFGPIYKLQTISQVSL